MNKRAIQSVCSILFIIIIAFGWSNLLKNERDALKKELVEIKSKLTSMEGANKDLVNQLEELRENNSSTKSSAINNKDNIYTIYTVNIDTSERQADAYLYIPDNTDIKQKLILISNVLSEGYFGSLPIEVVKIEKMNGKEIAIINLRESNENRGIKVDEKLKGKTWATNYLQGSAGGSITSEALIETLLQREHTGEWIDGVRFLYNGGPCDDDHFQHALDLIQINYRN